MKEQNDFAAQVAATEKAQAHAEEIKQTRIGGLGGSDAAMVLRIGQRGLSALTATDTKRLCVMVGKVEPDNFGGNEYTKAGHDFEEFAESVLPFGKYGYVRERFIIQPLAKSFKVFAHADFAYGEKRTDIVECKYVQKPTDKVIAEYYAQLQWYYMLGATSVELYHGQGAVPFDAGQVEACVTMIERDEDTIAALLAGIRTLDDALVNGWEPIMPDKVEVTDTPSVVQCAFKRLEELKAKEAELKAAKEEATATVREYIESFGLTGIVSGESKRQVIYTRASVSRSFDSAKFLKDHPEFNDVPEYWKTTNRAASITFK